MACFRLVLLFVSLIQHSSQIESTSQPTMFLNETDVEGTTCIIGNETCGATTDLSTELPTSNPTSGVNSSTEANSSTGAHSTTVLSTLSVPTTTVETPVSNSSASSTPRPTTTVAPPAHAVSNKIHTDAQLREGSACTCDLMVEECELNCCCDPDCKPYQVAVFSKCMPRPRPLFDDRMCHTVKTVIVNNTERLVEETRPGPFCIVKTNIATWVVHPTRPAILSESTFRRSWSLTRSSTWPQVEERSLLPTDQNPYVQDSFLWKFHPQYGLFFDLPSPSASPVCSARRSVRFLRSWTKSCVQQTPGNKAQCQQQSTNLFLREMKIIANPAAINRTKIALDKTMSCPVNLCAPVVPFNCTEEAIAERNFSSCSNGSNLTLSSFNEKVNFCHGVVKDLRLVITHNGTEGIKSIFAYFSLKNTSTVDPAPMLRTFSVDFQWISGAKNSSKANVNQTTTNTNITERSGHPGYIKGKPVLSGQRLRTTNSTKQNGDVTKQGEEPLVRERISHSAPDVLSVFGPGACELKRRHPVFFGEDIHVSCGVVLTQSNFSSPKNCTELRLNVLRHLLGHFNSERLFSASSFDTWGIVIGTFGDSNPDELSDWIPLILDGLSMTPAELTRTENRSSSDDLELETVKCEGIPTAVELRFLHSFVGSITNPQSKIIGASLRLEAAQDLFWRCDAVTPSEECVQRLHLTSSIKFVDVSSPAVAKFAEPPGIHIRLPPDFFYPFMVARNSSGNITPWIALLCLLIFLTLLYRKA